MSATWEYVEKLMAERDRVMAERDGLREIVKRAPHAGHCEARAPIFPGACNCWKREVV